VFLPSFISKNKPPWKALAENLGPFMPTCFSLIFIYIKMEVICISILSYMESTDYRLTNPGKDAGLEGITPRVVRELAVEIAPVLTTIYQISHNLGTVLCDWKLVSPVLHQYWWLDIDPDVVPVLVAGHCPRCCTSIGDWRLSPMLHQYWWLEIVPRVAPVFKKDLHYEYDPVNYHPLSLTSVLCKVVKHILVSSIINHLEIHQILTPQQHGFRKDTCSKQSCWSSLIADFQHGEGPTN